MSSLNALFAAANDPANLSYKAKAEAGKVFIAANAVSVEASNDLKKVIRAELDKEANSRAYSMHSYPSVRWDMIRDFDYFAIVNHGDVRVAHGLSRHQYNCGDVCCADHKGPVGSWGE